MIGRLSQRGKTAASGQPAASQDPPPFSITPHEHVTLTVHGGCTGTLSSSHSVSGTVQFRSYLSKMNNICNWAPPPISDAKRCCFKCSGLRFYGWQLCPIGGFQHSPFLVLVAVPKAKWVLPEGAATSVISALGREVQTSSCHSTAGKFCASVKPALGYGRGRGRGCPPVSGLGGL